MRKDITTRESRNELSVSRLGYLAHELAHLTEPLSVDSELLRRIGWVKREWIEDWRKRQAHGDEHGMGPPMVVPTLDPEAVRIRCPVFANDRKWGPDTYRIGLYQEMLDLFDGYMTTTEYHRASAIVKQLGAAASDQEIKAEIVRLFPLFPSARAAPELYTLGVLDLLTSETVPFSRASIIGGFAQLKRQPLEFLPSGPVIFTYVKEAEEKFQAISQPLLMLAPRRQQYLDRKTELETNYVTKEEHEQTLEEARKNREREAAESKEWRRKVNERRRADELQQFRQECQKLAEREQLLARLRDREHELREAGEALAENINEENFRRVQDVRERHCQDVETLRGISMESLPIHRQLALLQETYRALPREVNENAARMITVAKEIERLEAKSGEEKPPLPDDDDAPPF